MVYVPQTILLKTENLTEEELAIVQKHPLIAEKILSNLSLIKNVLPLIRHHHEKFDGSGYPDGIKGENIPIGARIISLFDCYDAMVSTRPHRPALLKEQALKELQKDANKQFDGKLVARFLEFIDTQIPSTGILPSAQEEEEHAAIRDSVKKIVADFKHGKIELPVLPKILDDVKKVINNQNSSIEDLAKAIEKDAVISVRLISVANSPIYRGADKIVTVKQAIPRMGTNEAQSIVTSIANKNMYNSRNKHFQMLMEKLWQHALATATATKIIVQRTIRTDPDKYYLLGLIHDIGKVLLLKAFSEIVPDAEELNMTKIMDTIQEYHANFGGALLKRWKFSKDFIHIVEKHESPQISSESSNEIVVICLANQLTRKIGYSLIDEEAGSLSETPCAQVLKLDEDALDNICKQTESIVQQTVNAF
jgi:putative nucleotidyltransferase with HDIG domain